MTEVDVAGAIGFGERKQTRLRTEDRGGQGALKKRNGKIWTVDIQHISMIVLLSPRAII